MSFRYYFEKIKNYFDQHEAKIASVALVAGFIFDYLTLRRVDVFTDNIFIILYLIFSGFCIIVINLYESGKWRNEFTENIYDFLPFILQFAFGGLFSAFVIFYSKSASFFTSGAFVLFLLVFLIGNEFFKKRYSKLVFQIGIYFIAIFSFSIYFLPVLIREMGVWIFLASGAISLALVSGFIYFISKAAPARYKEADKYLFLTVAGIFSFMNVLYFTNIIPPIPLSLRVGDVYHFAEKKPDGNYLVIGEQDSWTENFDLSQKVYLPQGKPVYVFSSVFAPANLDVTIMHDWQNYNEDTGEWVSTSRVRFPIVGGRDEGYRAFSKKENVFPGKWRVDIKTERGQVIGRVRFDIETGISEKELVAETL